MTRASSRPVLWVIDDEPGICDIVRFAGEQAGYCVTGFTDATEFLAELKHTPCPNVVVLDLAMPGTDGVQVIRALGSAACTAGLVLMSGRGGVLLHAAMEIALGQGLQVMGTLEKPVPLARLQAMLRSAPIPAKCPHRHHHAPTEPPPTAGIGAEEIRDAIARGSIRPFFQPRMSLDDGSLQGVEALARWHDRPAGSVGPDVFIPLAEAHGLIGALTHGMLLQSLAQTARWQGQGLDMDVSVNVSARLLTNLDYPDDLYRMARDARVDSEKIVIEVTESSAIEQLSSSMDILTRLRLKGFKLSIDDFGTGYSSMKQLQHAPFTELKVDQSFVMNMLGDPQAYALVEATIDMGHKLGMLVVAEGVEDDATWHALKALHCDQAQGFFMARPMPAEALEEWIRAGGAGAALAGSANASKR